MYLVDTNIVSTGARHPRPEAHAVATWMERHTDLLFLPVIAIAEIEDGIARLRRQGGTRRAVGLAEWRKARHFAPLGIPYRNPFEGLPP